MEPRIGRSIVQGFGAASRSWAGLGVFVGCWIAVLVLAVLGIALTNPPAELFEPTPFAEAPALPDFGTDEGVEAPDATATPEDLFAQMEEMPSEPSATEAVAPGEAAPPAEIELPTEFLATEPELAAPDAQQEQARRVVTQWFGRAWPMLLVSFLLVMAANLWLTGAQIGYLAKRVAGEPATLSEFWRAGARSFVPLLGATALFGLVIGLLALALGLISWLFSLLGTAAPQALVTVLALIVGLGVLVGFVWLLVRTFALWFIAVVVDRVGPIAGLKAGIRATRRRFWRMLGLGLLVLLISYGVWLPFGVLEWVGNLIGGGLGITLGLFSNLVGGLASVFVAFAVSAAFIRFYLDARAPSTG